MLTKFACILNHIGELPLHSAHHPSKPKFFPNLPKYIVSIFYYVELKPFFSVVKLILEHIIHQVLTPFPVDFNYNILLTST